MDLQCYWSAKAAKARAHCVWLSQCVTRVSILVTIILELVSVFCARIVSSMDDEICPAHQKAKSSKEDPHKDLSIGIIIHATLAHKLIQTVPLPPLGSLSLLLFYKRPPWTNYKWLWIPLLLPVRQKILLSSPKSYRGSALHWYVLNSWTTSRLADPGIHLGTW